MTDEKRPGVVHVYDDIEEEDNKLPNWWLAILFGTILFSFGYWLLGYTTDVIPTPGAEFRVEQEALKAVAAANKKALGEGELLALSRDAAALEEGKKAFGQVCASCHGQQGEGLVGPNLTDAHWIHGGKPESVLASIAQGFVEKGMPGWEATLGAQKTKQLAAYVLSLKGKNLAGKEPQGEKEE